MLWPLTTSRDSAGSLAIGGVSLSDLAHEVGTPLYIYDERTIREAIQGYRAAFERHYPSTRIAYAGKAYLGTWLLSILKEEGLYLDVVSGGELFVAHAAGFPMERVIFHGNNKTEDELRLALDLGCGEIVIDNEHEIDLLEQLGPGARNPLDVMLRISPGVDAHTHEYRKTGLIDSKFGLPIETGDAARAVEHIANIKWLRLLGYHAHVGSQIFEVDPFVTALDILCQFAADMEERFGVKPLRMSPGGGLGIQYETTDPDVDIDEYAGRLAGSVSAAVERYSFDRPELVVEPGRSMVGQAGVALYTVGAIKDIPGVRRYVSVDGGMADNIRPALYGARYSVALANREAGGAQLVTVAGKYCESGDVLIHDIELPPLRPGDLLATPAAGAYCLAMASNYNLAPRPAVVVVTDGSYRVVQRRERYEDLLNRDVSSPSQNPRTTS